MRRPRGVLSSSLPLRGGLSLALGKNHSTPLKLSNSEIEMLAMLSQSRSEPAGRVQRASILLCYHAGDTVSEIARTQGTNRPRVERCVSKALDLGVAQALVDLPGRGRRPAMTAEARAWVVALACQKPKDLGYAQSCGPQGCWRSMSAHTGTRLATRASPSWGAERSPRFSTPTRYIRTRSQYYLERRDPEFDAKETSGPRARFREVEIWREKGAPPADLMSRAFL